VSRAAYRRQLAGALKVHAEFPRDLDAQGAALLQSITQTS
jgi:hypothetical protein